jgi:hypothetical protein
VPFPELARRQGDAQERRGPLGIVAEGLVKVAEAKEDDGVRMLAFDSLVLLEDWDGLQGVA